MIQTVEFQLFEIIDHKSRSLKWEIVDRKGVKRRIDNVKEVDFLLKKHNPPVGRYSRGQEKGVRPPLNDFKGDNFVI